jgi:acetylornithine deacetylase
MVLTAQEARVVAEVERLAPRLTAVLGELMAFRTASQNPAFADYPAQAHACLDYLQELLRTQGFTTQRWEAAPATFPGHPVLAGQLPGAGGGRSIALNAHVDVVPPGGLPEDWSCTVRNGQVHGRGSLDMKGGVACMLLAVEALQSCGCRLAGDVWVHLVTDEEVVGWGTRECVARLPRTDAVLDPEPTNLAVVPIEGGLEHVRIEVEGREAHAGARWRSTQAGGHQGGGVNAIEKMLKIVVALQELERLWANTRSHPLFPPGYNSLLPGIIMGGPGGGHDGRLHMITNPGTTPNYCAVEYNIWYYPFDTIDAIKAELEDYILSVCRLDPWLREHPPRFTWALRNIRFPPFATDPDDPFVRVLRDCVAAAGITPVVTGFSAVADMAWYSAWGVPGALFGAGDVGLAHGPAEHVAVADLVAATQAMAIALLRWCGVGTPG